MFDTDIDLLDIDLLEVTSHRYRPEWHDDALCAEVGGDIFFPEKGESTTEAKRICAACPVRSQCLKYALDSGERFGVYGGLSERERRRVLKRRQKVDFQKIAA